MLPFSALAQPRGASTIEAAGPGKAYDYIIHLQNTYDYRYNPGVRADRILLARHSYAPGWRLPGGGVGWGEAPEAALMRELAEEVGLSGGTASLFGLYARKAGLASHVVALYRVTGAQIAFRPNWEIREILFADPAAPPAGTTQATARRLLELRGAAAPAHFW